MVLAPLFCFVFVLAFLPNGVYRGDQFIGHMNNAYELGAEGTEMWLEKGMKIFDGKPLFLLKVGSNIPFYYAKLKLSSVWSASLRIP